MSNWSFQLSLRNGFGVDLEVIPTQQAFGVEQTEEDVEPEVYDMVISGFELRLPFMSLMLTEVSYNE